MIARVTFALFAVAFVLSPDAVAAAPAERWVTLGGSVTETVFALGGADRLVGADDTSFYPAEAEKLPKVGYYRQISAEGVLSLRPSRVIADHGAGPPAAIEQIRQAGVPIEILPGGESEDGLRARIAVIAKLLAKDPRPLIAALDADLARLRALRARDPRRIKAVFVMARGAGALSVAGSDTTAQAMLEMAGGENAASTFKGYKPLTAEALVVAAPEVIVMTTRGLQSAGGIDGMLAAPGVPVTPAGRARRVVALDDLYLLGFGPRTGQAAIELYFALRGQRE